MPGGTSPFPPDAVAHLTAADPMFAACLAVGGPDRTFRREPGFGALLRIILEQQVSLASAEAVWKRLNARLTPLTAAGLTSLDDDALRGMGFSRQKAAYARGLAEAIVSGSLDLDALHRADDEEAVAMLVRLKGIGRWSAEIYLLMALGRADVFPADDLGVQLGVQRLKGLDSRPTRRELEAMAEPWRPYRATATTLVWHYYLTIQEARRSPRPVAGDGAEG